MIANDPIAPDAPTGSVSAGKDRPPSSPIASRLRRGPSPQKTGLTRHEIVNAALAEFMEVGIAGATMDKIAKRAGLAKGTLYLYFASKEALLEGALEATIAHTALAFIQNPRNLGETMHAYITRLVVPTMVTLHASGRLDLARLLLGEAHRYPGLAQFYRKHVYIPWHTHFAALMQTAIDEGELTGITPMRASLLLGAPFWVTLAYDTILGADQDVACGPAELMRAQINAIFGKRG